MELNKTMWLFERSTNTIRERITFNNREDHLVVLLELESAKGQIIMHLITDLTTIFIPENRSIWDGDGNPSLSFYYQNKVDCLFY